MFFFFLRQIGKEKRVPVTVPSRGQSGEALLAG